MSSLLFQRQHETAKLHNRKLSYATESSRG